jgi:hypothetical protein
VTARGGHGSGGEGPRLLVVFVDIRVAKKNETNKSEAKKAGEANEQRN